MNTRIRHSAFQLLIAVVLGAGLVACDSESQSATGPEEPSFSTVEGQVESTHETTSNHTGSVRPATTTSAGAPAAEASTVAVAAVQSNGSLDVLAEAEVQANGRFSIDEVPAGRSDLVVVARSDGGAEVGRALVHGETQANAVTTTAPINGETTVEGHVFTTLTEAGVSEEIRSTAQLALLLRLDESTASEVAASAQAIQDLAQAYRASAEAMNETFAATGAGVDGQARAEAMLQAAVGHAQNRDRGTPARAASEAFLQSGIDALIQAGASAEDVSLATTAAATGLDRAMVEANENARLDMARNAVELNMMARERLLAEHSEAQSSQLGAQALASARADVDASASLSEVAQALLDAEASFEEALMTMVLSNLSDVDESTRADVEAKLEAAFAEADFSARAEATVSVGEIVQAVVDYREQVQTAVQAFVDSLPAGGSVSAQVSAELLVAVQGGPSFAGSGS